MEIPLCPKIFGDHLPPHFRFRDLGFFTLNGDNLGEQIAGIIPDMVFWAIREMITQRGAVSPEMNKKNLFCIEGVE
ncbi:hypothetical protein TNIN_367401 [Trichonephila inaurata madagascariensis]|uniref:Uncharacterized protein n=1 Tax=Trichonephila inaurata madagascariensis TaxID=2747483 RepID=A0A8X6YZL3_9ARAC|nr:hypothetical protein TNIN_367401 [Trichonephila inaurata madagascariensis]